MSATNDVVLAQSEAPVTPAQEPGNEPLEITETIEGPKNELFGLEVEKANLGLLMDLKLEATIRFGQRELLLRDVLSLAPGAVVELDRQVNEPAELLVAGRLVARGEVVVVDGNFGLKITELSSRSDRAGLLRA